MKVYAYYRHINGDVEGFHVDASSEQDGIQQLISLITNKLTYLSSYLEENNQKFNIERFHLEKDLQLLHFDDQVTVKNDWFSPPLYFLEILRRTPFVDIQQCIETHFPNEKDNINNIKKLYFSFLSETNTVFDNSHLWIHIMQENNDFSVDNEEFSQMIEHFYGKSILDEWISIPNEEIDFLEEEPSFCVIGKIRGSLLQCTLDSKRLEEWCAFRVHPQELEWLGQALYITLCLYEISLSSFDEKLIEDILGLIDTTESYLKPSLKLIKTEKERLD